MARGIECVKGGGMAPAMAPAMALASNRRRERGEENKRKAAAGWQLLFALEFGGRRGRSR